MELTGNENPFYERYDELLDICEEYAVTISLGDACRPGSIEAVSYKHLAYAKPDKECLYNTLIMEEWETIAALGSGGSTKYVIHEENRMERIENVKSVDDYILRIDEMIERKKKLWH